MKFKNYLLITVCFVGLYQAQAQMYISEIQATNSTTLQYVELRGPASTMLGANDYLVQLGGNTSNAGKTLSVISLDGASFGANGYMVLTQVGNSYTVDAGAVEVTGTGTGWGSLELYGATTFSFSSNPSTSFLLISSAITPGDGTDYDDGNTGSLTGDATSWTIHDAVGFANPGDMQTHYLYGSGANFINESALGTTNTDGGTNIDAPLNVSLFSRYNATTGSTEEDWFIGRITSALPANLSTANFPFLVGSSINSLGVDNLDVPHVFEGTGDWSNTTRWNIGTVPTSSDNVVIKGTASIDLVGTPEAANILIEGTLNVNVDHTLVTGQLFNEGILNVNDGLLRTTSNYSQNGGTTNIGAGGSMTVQAFSNPHDDPFNMSDGGSLIVTGSAASGDITYTYNLASNNQWYLIGSPVIGQTTADFISDATGTLASGTGGNEGLAIYDNDDAGFAYYNTTLMTNPVGASMDNGTGYAINFQSPATPVAVFKGEINVLATGLQTTVGPGLFDSFILLSNPYPSYIAATPGTNYPVQNLLIINNNLQGVLDETTIWVYDPIAGYDTMNLTSTNSFLSPGQGFFVSTKVSMNPFTFNAQMRSHERTQTLVASRSSVDTRQQFTLFMTNRTDTRKSKLFYLDGTTTGWDNGYDSSVFGGNGFRLYTELVSDNNGKKLSIQSLPPSNFENMVIPVGVDAVAGQDVTFSANVENFPTGLDLYLEDKVMNTFTKLNDVNTDYTISLTSDLSGVGRFYLHTTSQSLSNGDIVNSNISAYTDSTKNLRITGVYNDTADVRVYNILGAQVLNTSFVGNGTNNVSLSTLKSGIYIVDIRTQEGKLNKKIIIE